MSWVMALIIFWTIMSILGTLAGNDSMPGDK